MPTELALPITTATIWISAAVVLLLISIPVFVTRAFLVKKIARYQAALKALEEANQQLKATVGERLNERKDDSKNDKGWVQQAVSAVLAIGGLAGLLTAATPLLHEIRDIQATTQKLDQQQKSLDFFNGLLGYSEANWKESVGETPLTFKAAPKPRAFSYDGKRPTVIELEDGALIKFTLPRKGARFLLRLKPEAK
ncbi:hypothetical protein [Paludibaculum fermentans]|uniref:hypothetical protein n=1 Tax=Paludibaculum fermentans TaxID=1473598 RepID=UPI003EBFB462